MSDINILRREEKAAVTKQITEGFIHLNKLKEEPHWEMDITSEWFCRQYEHANEQSGYSMEAGLNIANMCLSGIFDMPAFEHENKTYGEIAKCGNGETIHSICKNVYLG